MESYIIHYGTANSGRFKKGSVGNTAKSRELLNKKSSNKSKNSKSGSDKTKNVVSKNKDKKLSSISKKEYSKFEKIANDVIRGNYGNGEVRKQKMKKAGYDYDTVQNIVNNKLIGTKLNFTVKGSKSKSTKKKKK